MTDKTTFKKTLYLFNHEANTLLRSSWEESPTPFKRFLDRIEQQPDIKTYLDDCVDNHTPAGFDPEVDVKAVAKDMVTTFVNFSTVPEEESAEVYLILKEIVAQEIQGHSNFYFGFAHGNKYADMYKGFLDKVVRRLIANITEYLTMIGIEMGLDDTSTATTNFYGNVQQAQINQPSGGSTVNATQTNGLNADELNNLLDAIITAAESGIDDAEMLEDICDNVEIVRAQMESGEPKRGILKSALNFLGGVNGGVQFTAALVQIVEFVNNSGFQFPLPG